MGHYTQAYLNMTGDRLSDFARLRVDDGQTGFFEGREFRAYQNFSLNDNSVVLRFTSPVDFILFDQSLLINSGNITLNVMIEGTPGGSWSSVPIWGKNRMTERRSPYYEGQATLDSGGTHTGGTEVDSFALIAPGTGSNQSTIGGGQQSERGLPAGTYYLKANWSRRNHRPV